MSSDSPGQERKQGGKSTPLGRISPRSLLSGNIVLIPNKKWRMCVDYTDLNDA